MPTLLWEPPAQMVERALMTRYMGEQGHSSYEELWRWSVEDLEGFWASIWDFFDVAGALRRACSASAEMPGAEWFPGARVNYAEHVFRGKDAGAGGDRATPPSCASSPSDVGRAARADRAHRRRPAGARRRARRPRGRLPAEHPRDDGGVPRLRLDRRGLVELLAGLRRPLGDRPLRPDRAQGAAGGRRLPLQRARLRPPRDGRGDRRRGRRPRRQARLPRRQRLGGRLRGRRRRSSSSRCPSTTRCGSSTPRAPPACRRRSCTARAGSCSST